MIKQRTREELYDLFRQGAIPSGADFADFIKSQLNLLDDKIEIAEDADQPIGFRAHGAAVNYLDFAAADGGAKWRFSGFDEALETEGLNLTAEKRSKLFIERETGNVGISTDGPEAKLHIIQTSAIDALRIDDAGTDTTPLVVTSEGWMGIGTASPSAQLHLSYSGSGDILRVDDNEGDGTPLIINDIGNVGIGYSKPKAKLTVDGGITIGANEYHGDNNLYVAGDIEVEGTVVFSNGSGVSGIEINAPLTSKTTDLTIKDNLIVIGDRNQAGSDGNLTVAGDTTLGVYNAVYERQNVLKINGRIESGGDFGSGAQQDELEINKVLSVNRATGAAGVAGNLTVTGTSTLGDTPSDKIYLNGTVSSTQGDVVVDDDFLVKGSTRLGDAQADQIYLNGTVSSQVGNVTIDDNLTVTGSTSLGKLNSDKVWLNGTVKSNTGTLQIEQSVVIAKESTSGGNLSVAGKVEIAGVNAATIDIIPPLGSIIAWHKHLKGTAGTLPKGWVECNGQICTTEDSPYKGSSLPDLNNKGYFLRGSTTSGIFQTDSLKSHTHVAQTIGNHNHNFADAGTHGHSFGPDGLHQHNTGPEGGPGDWSGTGYIAAYSQHKACEELVYTSVNGNHNHGFKNDGGHNHNFTADGSHTHRIEAEGGTETRPVNMAVVWIMRVL